MPKESTSKKILKLVTQNQKSLLETKKEVSETREEVAKIQKATLHSVKELKKSFTELKQSVSEIKTTVINTQELIMDLSGSIVDFANNTQEQFDLVKGTMTTLPTKAYIDDKINSLRGDFVVAVKNNESKINLTILKLESKKVLSQKDRQDILDIQPFTKE
jgi:hypothetical protein